MSDKNLSDKNIIIALVIILLVVYAFFYFLGLWPIIGIIIGRIAGKYIKPALNKFYEYLNLESYAKIISLFLFIVIVYLLGSFRVWLAIGYVIGYLFVGGNIYVYRDFTKKEAISLDEAYLVFGVDATVTQEELKRIYRQLMHKYHPDKTYGLSDEEKIKFEDEAKEINLAYDTINKHRGW